MSGSRPRAPMPPRRSEGGVVPRTTTPPGSLPEGVAPEPMTGLAFKTWRVSVSGRHTPGGSDVRAGRTC